MLGQLFETAKERIHFQNSACDSINQKIGTLIGFAGVIVTIAIGFDKNLNIWQERFFIIGSIFVGISIVILYIGYRKISISLGMKIRDLIELIKNKSSQQMFTFTQIIYLKEAYKKNKDKLRTKELFLGWGSLALIIGVVFFIGTIFV